MTKRSYISQYIRYKVLKRQNFRCSCGKKLKFKSSQKLLYDDGAVVAHVDHIIPLSKGGADDITNMQAMCGKCNLGKGAKMPTKIKTGGMSDLEICNEIDKLKCLVSNARPQLKRHNIGVIRHWDNMRVRLELFLPAKRRVMREDI